MAAVRFRTFSDVSSLRKSLIAVIVAAALCVWGGQVTFVRAAAGSCTVSLASPLLVPIGGVPGGAVIDDACQYVYVTNPIMNRVEVFSLKTLRLEATIQVGAQPVGLDTTPDGQFLYVANSGGNNLSVVDLARRREVRKIRVPTVTFSNDRPYSVVVASNGKAFFTTTFSGSGFGGRVLELDLATDQTAPRTDITPNASTLPRTYLRRSHDRAVVALAESQDLQTYKTSTNAFTLAPNYFNIFVSDLALDLHGTTMLVNSAGLVLDANLSQIGTISGGTSAKGAVISPQGTIAYRVVGSSVHILNVVTFLKTGEMALGATTSALTPYAGPGQMAISSDGQLLVVTTDTGFVVLQAPGSNASPGASGDARR